MISGKEALKMLVSTTCRCGISKKKMQVFCNTCYFKLPEKMRRNLYKKVGDGFKEAVNDAVEYMEANHDGK